MNFLKKILFNTVLILACALYGFAQPANDDCTNASVVAIPGGGFGLGTVVSANSDLTSATLQAGEPIYSIQVSAGTDKKSVWYKFTLPTNRGVNLELKQPTTLIPLNEVGFTVYKAPSCMPTLADIGPARLTPINQFGSSFNPCLDAGDYWVQITSTTTANGPIFIELTFSYPTVLNDYDLTSTRYDFGVVSGGWDQVTYDVGCQTIDDATEVCPELGANYLDYTQSTWMTFTSDAHADLFRIEMGATLAHADNYRVGYNLYEGDCFTSPGTLSLISGCNVLEQTSFNASNPQSTWPGNNHVCDFQGNTTYSIQIFYELGYVNTVGVRLYEIGIGPTDAELPAHLGFAPGNTNALGVLPSSAGGITTNGTDVLSCEAQLVNNPCGTVNPVAGSVPNGGDNYDLATWYTFTLSQTSNITITSSNRLLKRLFVGDVFTDCNLTPSIDFTSANYSDDCLAPGTYSIQLLGEMDTTGTNFMNQNLNQLAHQANIGINVRDVQNDNLFNLTDATLATGNVKVDELNGGANLVSGTTYNAATDEFACVNTLLPAGSVCNASNTKAMYRTFSIATDGVVQIGGGNANLNYRLYEGNAQTLANAQNVFQNGQTITGLIDLLGCVNLAFSNPKVCLTAGEYTLVTFGAPADIGQSDDPWVIFTEITTQFYDPTAPNNMGTLSTFPVSGTEDFFSCLDNPNTIDGIAPCFGRQKLIYREFFLAAPEYINITSTHTFFLFSGQVSAGTASATIPGYGVGNCTSNFQADDDACTPMPLPGGWYTVVSYGNGGNYVSPITANGSIGQANNITITTSTPPTVNPSVFDSPANANNIGTVLSYPTSFTADYFDCDDNAVTIDGIAPCGGNSKAIYREFYLPVDTYLNINSSGFTPFHIFSGQISAGPVSATIPGLGIIGPCTYYYNSSTDPCDPEPMPAGWYTIVQYRNNVGGTYNVTLTESAPPTPPTSAYGDPNNPENMGTISTFPTSGTNDVFVCSDNPNTIDGIAPCYGRQKLIYREFYLASPEYIRITGNPAFHIFQGQVSAGTATANVTGYGTIPCTSNFSCDIDPCNPIPFEAGWYTVVSYGTTAGQNCNINIQQLTPAIIPDPLYNRPYKAYVANGGAPITWGPNSNTAAVPLTRQIYTFGTENFGCFDDLPFAGHPINECRAIDNRVVYYVFELNQESYVKIMDIPTSMISKIYNLDVTTADSTLMPTATPIQTCVSTRTMTYDNLGWTGEIEICRMQPGTYTLVVFANDAHYNTTLTPRAYVEKVESSRFDHANNAYDFGDLPNDNVMYYGKPGDTNPLEPTRSASNDFFACVTGAQPSDPANFCWDGIYPTPGSASVPYPMPTDYSIYQGAETEPPVRRNLWYTFTVTGPGTVVVNVDNLTPGETNQYPYSIYRSDVNGTIPFNTVIANGDVDSTLAQGLTLVTTVENPNTTGNSNFSWGYCYSNASERSFLRSQCGNNGTDRYYIVVDHHSHTELNNQVEVGVRFEPITASPTVYDHFAHANVINGLNQVSPPYTTVPLSNGTFSGDPSNFTCATDQPTDPNSCGVRTLWWKYTVDATGFMNINATIDGNNIWNNNNVQLYKEIIPGDSAAAALEQIPLTYDYTAGQPWGQACMNPGTYYILLTGCNYTVQDCYPNILLDGQTGDFCDDPVTMNLVGPTTVNASVLIDCHTMLPDFGEDGLGAGMGCLFGPDGYKSTWYKVTVTATQKEDITFELSESTTAFPNQIRYRVMYGSCGAMTAGPCNSDALTQFTLNCIPIGTTDYYVQIVEPIDAMGTINLSVTATISPDQSCIPFNPNVPITNFTVGPACDGEVIDFTNQSTMGADMTYLWDFGHAGATSTDIHPTYTYPVTGTTTTYNVTLTSTNTANGQSSNVVIPVTIYTEPSCNITRDAPFNGPTVPGSVGIDFHANATGTIVTPASTYFWDFGNGQTSNVSDPTGVMYNTYGTYDVTLVVSNGTCSHTCTETITVAPENIFAGGINDGAASILINACTVENIFGGGVNDGAAAALIVACSTEQIFGGGINDGAAVALLVGCIKEPIYGGGIRDGSGKALAIRDPGNCSVVLPVELISFNVVCEETTSGRKSKVYWATGTETNNDFFTVERSIDGFSWKSVGEVESKGNSSDLQTYEFMDNERAASITYYRLKQTDFDGAFDYSNVISIEDCMEEDEKYFVYPNPTNGETVLEIYEKNSIIDDLTIKITNSVGEKLFVKTIQVGEGMTYEQLNLSQYDPGVYNVILTKGSDSKPILMKVVKI